MTQSPLDRARLYQDELTAIRRDIHAHPELGFEEERTSKAVAVIKDLLSPVDWQDGPGVVAGANAAASCVSTISRVTSSLS